MLRFVEEIVLLLLHDDDGSFVRVSSWSRDYAIAGSVLMDLAMENRIDTDLENLTLIDATPLGDSLLDPTLAEIAAGEQHSARFWVEHTATRAAEIYEQTLARLVDHGILEQQEERFLWVFRSRRYPMVDGTAEREVKLRIMPGAVQRRDPGPARRRDHLPGRRMRPLQGAAVEAGAGSGDDPHRSGPQAGPDRPGDVAGDRRHRDVHCLLGGGSPLLAVGSGGSPHAGPLPTRGEGGAGTHRQLGS